MKLTKEQIQSVKARGFLLNRGTEKFSGRIVPVAGVYSAEELESISECARKFGSGTVAFTSRLAAEIVGIPFEKIDEADAFARSRGLVFGGTGAKVRPVTSCKGTTCVYGNIDTQKLGAVLHEKFYLGMSGVKLPHKFKIGVGGCPNSCMKPSLNDVGIEGRCEFEFDGGLCRGCARCAVETVCPSRAVKRQDGKVTLDPEKCLSCGVCIGKCPFGAVPKSGKRVCTVYVGGTWGKYRREGTPLSRTFSEEEIPELVEKIMLWYKDNAFEKERLGKAVDRIGMQELEKALFSDGLSSRREEILAADIKKRS